MRRIATAVSAVAVVLLSASLFAQAKPNFSGKWTMDAEKTAAANPAPAAGGGGGRAGGGGGGRGGGAGAMTVTMDATTLKMERDMGGNMMATIYKLDGSESKNMAMGRGGQTEQVSHAKIDGAKVVITTAGPNGDQTTTWSMDGDWLVSDNGMRKTYYKKG